MNSDELNQPIAHTSQTDITLDQLGSIQPGLARLMAEISDRYWILYYAAKNGNWKMASLQSSEIRKAFDICIITRPKYKKHLDIFSNGPLLQIDRAIANEDWIAFESTYMSAIDIANAYHKSWDHEEIVWQLPDEPPKHLNLKPQ